MTARSTAPGREEGAAGAVRSAATLHLMCAQLLEDMATLERRVLAHEHILQSLIAHMAETEPRFLARLADRFSDPIGAARSEHPQTSSNGYADAFVKAIELLVTQACRPPIEVQTPVGRDPAAGASHGPASPAPPAADDGAGRVSVRNRSGVWEVKVDGQFFGDFTRQRQADQVAAVLQAMIGVELSAALTQPQRKRHQPGEG